MSHFLAIVLPLIFFCIASVGAGALAMQCFTLRPRDSALVELVMAFLFGQAILGSVYHFPALLKVFTLPVILSITLPFAGWGLFHLYCEAGNLKKNINHLGVEFRKASWPWKLMVVAVLLILILGGSANATLLTVDARAFYMVVPKLVAYSHRLIPLVSYENFSGIGLLAEMQLAALFLFGMPGSSARLLCWLVSLAAGVILVAICRKAGLGRRAQLLALVMLATSTAAAWLWGSGKTDFFGATYGLCAVYYALCSWDKAARKKIIPLIGLFIGFALVAKLSYLVALMPGIFILMYWHEIHQLLQRNLTRSQFLTILRNCTMEGVLLGVFIVLAFVPLLIKNVLFFGAPFNAFTEGFNYFSPITTHRIVMMYPFVMTFGDYWAQFGDMSPLLLAFLPLGLIGGKRGKPHHGPVAAITVAALVGLLAWVFMFPSVPFPRYFLTTLIILIVPAAWSAQYFSDLGRVTSRVVWLLAFVMLVIFYLGHRADFFNITRAYHYAVSADADIFTDNFENDLTTVGDAINAQTEPGARVMTFVYSRNMLRGDLIQCANSLEVFNVKDHDLFSSFNDDKSVESVWINIRKGGFSYLMVDDSFVTEKRAPLVDPKHMPSWVKLEPIISQTKWQAYRIIYRHPPVDVTQECKQTSPDAWDVVPIH